jgi:hypothetical protein
MPIRVLFCILVTFLCISAQSPCTVQNLSGTFAMSNEGLLFQTPEGATKPQAVPMAQIGMAYIDLEGKVTGWITMNAGGKIEELEIGEGTATVSLNCTGTMTLKLKDKASGTILPNDVIAFFAVDSREPLMIHSTTTQGPVGPVVDNADWTRVLKEDGLQETCAASRLAGVFIAEARPTLYVTLPDSSVTSLPASWIFLGNAGQVVSTVPMPQNVMSETSLEVGPGCSGTFKFKMKDPLTGIEVPGQGIEKFVVVSNGDRMIVKAVYVQGVSGRPAGLETWIRVAYPPLPAPSEIEP